MAAAAIGAVAASEALTSDKEEEDADAQPDDASQKSNEAAE